LLNRRKKISFRTGVLNRWKNHFARRYFVVAIRACVP
jgi:hypothetical protein